MTNLIFSMDFPGEKKEKCPEFFMNLNIRNNSKDK